MSFHIHKTTAWAECWHMLLSKVRLFSYSCNKNSGKKCLINAAVMPYLHSSECGRTLKWIFTHHQTVNGYYNNKCPLAYSQFWHFPLMDKNTYFFPLYLLINGSVSWGCDLHFRLVDWGCFHLWGRLTLLCAFALLLIAAVMEGECFSKCLKLENIYIYQGLNLPPETAGSTLNRTLPVCCTGCMFSWLNEPIDYLQLVSLSSQSFCPDCALLPVDEIPRLSAS